METKFLATVIGWFMVTAGFCLLFRHQRLSTVMTDVMSRSGIFFVFALMTFILGLLMVVGHNIWLMGWPVIITIFGWLVLCSGIIRLFFPDTALKIGKSFFNNSIIMQITGVVVLIIGVFLLYNVYFIS